MLRKISRDTYYHTNVDDQLLSLNPFETTDTYLPSSARLTRG